MAAPLTAGLTPSETSFLAEMTLITIIPRQRLSSLSLLSGPTPTLAPPHRTSIPLWLALLLKRQDRANILPPPWLHVSGLEKLLEYENSMPGFAPGLEWNLDGDKGHGRNSERRVYGHGYVGPPFVDAASGPAVGEGLPYHWMEISHLILEGAAEDVEDAGAVRRLLRDLRETRAAKLRRGVEVLDGGRQVVLDGVGGMEVAENRAFVAGVVDGLRKIGASRETARREREAEERERGGEEDEDEDML